MNRMLAFSARNNKEVLRDPLTAAFGLGFPAVILLLLTLINSNIPAEAQMNLFNIDHLAPSVPVFGLSFVALMAGLLVAKDRCSSVLYRMMASPLTAAECILGYTLPMLPIALGQIACCFIMSFILGLQWSWNVLLCVVVLLPTAVLFIAIGLLCGSLLNDKQVGGICGALLTNLSAWLSGIWFDINLLGGAFEKIAYALPFAHGVDAARAALNGNPGDIFPHLWWVIGYAVVLLAVAIFAFRKKLDRI